MASDPQTWTELQASIKNWIIRDDQDARIPEYIALAERRLSRAVFCPEREGSTTLVASAEVGLPADFWGVRALWLTTDPVSVLEQMSLVELKRSYPVAAPGRPANFSIIGGKTLALGPAPDSAYDIGLVYWKTIPALGESVSTNWLLTLHPDLYLAACLTEAYLGVVDDKAAFWNARTEAMIEDVNISGRRKQYGGAPFRIRSAVVV